MHVVDGTIQRINDPAGCCAGVTAQHVGRRFVFAGFFADESVIFKRTGQELMQDWLVEMVKRLVAKLPVTLLWKMGLANVLRPRTSGWAGARDAIQDYVDEKNAEHRKALRLDELVELAKQEVKPDQQMAAE